MKIKILFYLTILTLALTGCNDMEKVSGRTFQSEYERGNMETMHSVEYLGVKEGKAYLKKSTKSVLSGKWDSKVIYADLSDLDEAFRQKLSGK